jgi:hypothetical protein
MRLRMLSGFSGGFELASDGDRCAPLGAHALPQGQADVRSPACDSEAYGDADGPALDDQRRLSRLDAHGERQWMGRCCRTSFAALRRRNGSEAGRGSMAEGRPTRSRAGSRTVACIHVSLYPLRLRMLPWAGYGAVLPHKLRCSSAADGARPGAARWLRADLRARAPEAAL